MADLEVLGTPCHPHSTEEAENLRYSRGGAESVPLPHAIVVKSSLCVVNNADMSQNNEKHVDHDCF